nr:coiled coil domain containing protein 51 [Hymenolepis microstoma]
MPKNLRLFFPRMYSFIRKSLNRNDLKFINLNILSTRRFLAKDSKHLENITSAYHRLESRLSSNINFSIDKFSSIYDRISGRDAVTNARNDLREAEQDFVSKQLARRTLQQSLFDVQKKRSELNKKVKVTSIADDSYLPLITKELELAREEARVSMEHRESDLLEKAAYDNFTSLMRNLHAEERNYDQRMRIWTLIGSVVLAIFSIFVNWLRYHTPRMADISNSLDMIKEVSSTQEEIRTHLVKLIEHLRKQEEVLSALQNLGAASQNSVSGNITKESSNFKRSNEEEATGYFGWESVIGTVAAVAILALCLI